MRKLKYKSPTTNGQLARIATDWQRRLRLQDWVVQIGFVNKAEKDGLKICFASTTFSSGQKAVVIQVAKLIDVLGSIGCHDLEVTVVHELLHLHADPFDHACDEDKAPAEYEALEAMIELTAIALVEAKRGTPRKNWS
jgi:hypothetical protein